jgi:pimeloyl-ACP methyl ester carboxylesterase
MDQTTTNTELFAEPPPSPVDASEHILPVSTAKLWLRRAEPSTPCDQTVVFLHPWTGSGHCWSYQEAAFTEAGHRTICYSRRGYRGSDCGESGDEADAVDDLHRLVDALELDRFHLVGSAAGAMTAAGFALRHRDDRRLASVTLACSMIGIAPDQVDGLESVTSFAQWRDLPHHVRELGPSYRAVNPTGAARWRDLHDRCRGDNPADHHQPLGGPTTLADLGRIAAPTLYIAGSADLYSPPPLLELFANRTPGSRFAIIDGAGHSAYWERPSAFNQLVLEFIDRHRQARRPAH